MCAFSMNQRSRMGLNLKSGWVSHKVRRGEALGFGKNTPQHSFVECGLDTFPVNAGSIR